MIGIYFSGTGNTKYCVEKFLEAYEAGARAFSIEEDCALHNIEAHEEIVIGYPVQYSTVPKILRDYITAHQSAWKGKKSGTENKKSRRKAEKRRAVAGRAGLWQPSGRFFRAETVFRA